MKTFLSLLVKILLGIFVFYLFVCLVVIPLAVPPIVNSQASTILKHPVYLRSVSFNPFLWRLTVSGLEVRDKDKQVLAGFERLAVDVSFLRLLAKEIRVEFIELDGLRVNAALSKTGQVNLMELVPGAGSEASQPGTKAAPAAAKAAAGKPDGQPPALSDAPGRASAQFPLVIVDRITLRNGAVRFTDESVSPPFAAQLAGMECDVTGLSTRPDSLVRMVFHAKLDDKGLIAVEAMVRPWSQPLELETDFQLSGYALHVVTPYTGKYTGRAVSDGKLDLKMVYRISDNKLAATHKLLIQKFTFGQKVESKDALGLPFGLAVALLEDPQGRIAITLPVNGDMSSPQFHYFHLVGQVARNFFMKLVTKPFTFLASILGSESGVEEMGYTRFAPGQSVLSNEDKVKLDTIIKGLKERPKLFLQVCGAYDPDTDWKLMKQEALDKEYKQLRENSRWPDSRLYQTMFVPRFGRMAYSRLEQKYRLPNRQYDSEKMDAEVKRMLLEEGKPDRAVLESLAQARAKTVFDYIAASGFDSARLGIGTSGEAQASMGFVPMELNLTVFGEK